MHNATNFQRLTCLAMVLSRMGPVDAGGAKKIYDMGMGPPKERNPLKVKRAAADPKRPGQERKADPAAFHPVVNRTRCEGKGDCIEVCPYDVFEISTIDPAEYRTLPLLARLKVRVHGMKTVYTPRADACKACGLCVVACPEKALTLEART